MEFRLIYVTVKDRNEAENIAKELVGERLAACINIVDNIQSIYRWDNKICMDKEVILIAKTRASLTSAFTAMVKSLHSYECPCIVVLPILEGFTPFLNWIEKETKEEIG